jgi:hypothetical protein
MQLTKHLTVKGIQSIVFDFTLTYVKRLGYEIMDVRPDFMVVSKKKLVHDSGGEYELWLTVAITGESYVTVFMDYQLRGTGSDADNWADYRALVKEIEQEYHTLWLQLSHLAEN